MEYHFKAKRLLAANFSLKTFAKAGANVKLLSGNSTTVHDMNNMHSKRSHLCHSIISEILAWAEGFALLLSAFQERRTKIQNHEKKKKTELEWILNQHIFTKVVSKFQF